MRLCRFSDGDADPKLGLVEEERVIDLSASGLPAEPALALAAPVASRACPSRRPATATASRSTRSAC